MKSQNKTRPVVWGTVGTIAVGLIVAAVSLFLEYKTGLFQDRSVDTSASPTSPLVSDLTESTRDGRVSYEDDSSTEQPSKEEPKRLTGDVLKALMPDMRGGGASPRYIDSLLGVPIDESETRRVYIIAGHRIEVSWGRTARPSEFVIGPAEGETGEELQRLDLGGAWGRLSGRFGDLTVGDVLAVSSHCWLSDWNYRAHGRCFNFFEIECGGSQSVDGLYYRTGIDSCSFSNDHLNQEAINLQWPEDEILRIPDHEFLEHPAVRRAKVNFFMVTDKKRQCPRGAGC